MNYNIIRKCIEELNKEDFRKDYVLGMLEGLSESQPTVTQPINNTVKLPKSVFVDEGDTLNAEANVRLKNIDFNSIKND